MINLWVTIPNLLLSLLHHRLFSLPILWLSQLRPGLLRQFFLPPRNHLKLISNSLWIHVPHQQPQNGFCERNFQLYLKATVQLH